MKTAIILLVALSVVFCADISNLCQDSERSVFACNRISKPVCAFSEVNNSETKSTISNRCEACKSTAVKYIAEGACESYPSGAHFCDPSDTLSQICFMAIFPVCAYDESKTPQTYGNSCFACRNSKIVYYADNACA